MVKCFKIQAPFSRRRPEFWGQVPRIESMGSNVSIHTNSTDTSTSNTAGAGLSCSDKATMPFYQAMHKEFCGKEPIQSLPAACEHTDISSLKWRVRWARRLHWDFAENFFAGTGRGWRICHNPPAAIAGWLAKHRFQTWLIYMQMDAGTPAREKK